MLHEFCKHHFSTCTLFALFATVSWAALTPRGDSLQDAANDGRTPDCDTVHLGSPPLEECNAAVSSFLGIILSRGISLDLKIEFIEPGTAPLHADQYPRQPLTEHGDYHTFIGSPNSQRNCVLRFYIGNLSQDPASVATSVSTYRNFLNGAHLLLNACVAHGQGGWFPIRTKGRLIGVSMEEGVRGDPLNNPRLAATRNYRISPSDIHLIPRQGASTSGVGPSAIGGPGQSSSTGSGTFQGQTFCNTQQSPSTCPAGSSCENVERVQDADDSWLRVYWGETARLLLDMYGTCSAEFRS